jgi:energy-converting hydrogenase Eha subunit E
VDLYITVLAAVAVVLTLLVREVLKVEEME